MKVTSTALLLGCTAMICVTAVRSEFSLQKTTQGTPFLHSHSLADGRWFPFFQFEPAQQLKSAPENKPTAPVIPLISKAEALSLISGAAAKYSVPREFVTSIVAAESNFVSTAVSTRGAIGLMQLMPDTARQFNADPMVPVENVDAGTHYLRWLMERYRNSRGSTQRVIAAYNAGPGMVDHYRGVPPFRETRTYVARVMSFLKQFSPGLKVKYNDYRVQVSFK